MTCLCVLTSVAQHKRWATIRHLNTVSQGWLSIQSCSVCGLRDVEAPGKTHRQRTAHRPESLVGRNFASLNRCHREVGTCSIPLASRTDGESLQGNSQQRQRVRCADQETPRGRPPSPDNSSTDDGKANRTFALRQSTRSRRRFSFLS